MLATVAHNVSFLDFCISVQHPQKTPTIPLLTIEFQKLQHVCDITATMVLYD